MYLSLQFAAEVNYDFGDPLLKFGYFYTESSQSSPAFFPLIETKYCKTTINGVTQESKKNNVKYFDRNFETLHRAISRVVPRTTLFLNDIFIRNRKNSFDYLGINTEGDPNKLEHYGVYQYTIKMIIDHYQDLIFDSDWTTPCERVDYPASTRDNMARRQATFSKRGPDYNPSKPIQSPTKVIGNALTRYAFMVNEVKKADKETEELRKLKETEKKEDIKMPEVTRGTATGTTTTIAAFTDAFKHGAKVAAADEAANAVLGIAETIVGDSYPELAKTENGKIVAKLLAATLLHYAAGEKLPFIPEPEAVRTACNLVIEAGARDLIQPKIAIITPCVTKLAEIGKQIAAGG